MEGACSVLDSEGAAKGGPTSCLAWYSELSEESEVFTVNKKYPEALF